MMPESFVMKFLTKRATQLRLKLVQIETEIRLESQALAAAQCNPYFTHPGKSETTKDEQALETVTPLLQGIGVGEQFENFLVSVYLLSAESSLALL